MGAAAAAGDRTTGRRRQPRTWRVPAQRRGLLRFAAARRRAAARAGEVRRGRPRAGRGGRATCPTRRKADPLAIARSRSTRSAATRRAPRGAWTKRWARTPTRQADVRLLLARAAVDERRGDWQRALARARAAAGEEAAQRRGAELRRLRRRRPRPRPAARDQAAAGGGGDVARLGRGHRQPGLGVFPRRRSGARRRVPGAGGAAGAAAIRRCCSTWAICTRAARNATARSPPTGARWASSPTDRVARELGDRIRTLEAKSAAGR